MTPLTRAHTRPSDGKATLLAVTVLVVAAGAALSGLVLIGRMAASRPPESIAVPAGQEAQSGGLSLRVYVDEWLSHAMMPNVPSSAMPDMPADGELRLRLAFTLQNDGSLPLDFAPDDFRVRSSSGESWSPYGSNFMAGTVGPGQGLNGSMFFHVPETESGLRLVWTRGNTEMEIPLSDVPVGNQGYGDANRDDDHDHDH